MNDYKIKAILFHEFERTHAVTYRWCQQEFNNGRPPLLTTEAGTKGVYVVFSTTDGSPLRGVECVVVKHVIDDLWLFEEADGWTFQGQLCDFAELPA